MTRGKLDQDELAILKALKAARDDGEGAFVHAGALQRASGVLFIRTPLDRLKRRGFVDHDGARSLIERYWKITDAGLAGLAEQT